MGMIFLILLAGVVSFYKDFVEEVFELLGGNASVTGKSWDPLWAHGNEVVTGPL